MALEEINDAIKIITKGTLYDAIDIVDQEVEAGPKQKKDEVNNLANAWYQTYKKATPISNNADVYELQRKKSKSVQGSISRSISTRIVVEMLQLNQKA